jgi:hypothetical protein
MKYTLGTAAKACGVARTTILRAIKSGRITAPKDDTGSYAIDPSELHRVFPPVRVEQFAEQAMERYAIGDGTSVTAVLLAKIEGLEALLNRERETVTDLRQRLDQSEAERRETQGKLTALLTHQPKAHPAPEEALPPVANEGKGRLWQKLFGK